ncbi:MAG: ornithine carbamoyltransferase [Lachnospiraceae bacterium]|nr:ornithine carbamoyltransferase [Lachnospiraceae bacterium]
MTSLKGRNLLTLKDYTPEEIRYFLELAAKFKKLKKDRVPHDRLKGLNVALVFEKNSTRTRCSFEVAAYDLGMHCTFLDPKASQLGKKESIADTAAVLGRMFDGIEYRGYGQERVECIAKYAHVPVWNGLTNEYHPTQILADIMTVQEYFGDEKGKKLVYLGDARYNIGNSLMVGCAKLGLHFVVSAPKAYFPSPELVAECEKWADESGGSITMSEDPMEAVEGADVVYTDVWLSMGEPERIWAERIRDLSAYKVTMDIMKKAKKDAIFMHCLPSFHDHETELGEKMGEIFDIADMEVTDEVFQAYRDSIFDEAENRMHTIKAVMAATLGYED